MLTTLHNSHIASMLLTVLLLNIAAFQAFPPVVLATPDEEPATVIVNGQLLNPDVPPLIENDRILVPVRAITEALGADVQWHQAEQMATIRQGDTLVTLWIDKTLAMKGDQELILDAPPRAVNQRTLVPLRFITETLGASAEWRPESREAIINQSQNSANDNMEKTVYDEAGVYGPDSGTDSIRGDVTVKADGVTLQNLVVTGNLIIDEAVGDGEVSLNNVTVEGDTRINGGGPSSVNLSDFSCGTVIVNDPDGNVHIYVTGNSGIATLNLQSGASLETGELSSISIGELNIDVPAGSTVILIGHFGTVNCHVSGLTMSLLSGIIQSFMQGSEAGGLKLNLGADASIDSCTLNARASITGSGSIGTLRLNCRGVSLPAGINVESLQTGPNIHATLGPNGLVYESDSSSSSHDDAAPPPAPPAPAPPAPGPAPPPPPPPGPPPALAISAAGDSDQINWDESLALTSNYPDTAWAITNSENSGASLSSLTGASVNVLGPAAPGGSGSNSSGRCVVTATRAGESVQYAIYVQGDGSQAYPYIIRDGAGLAAMRNSTEPGDVAVDSLGHDISGYDAADFYKMVADISLAAYQPWTPITLNENFPAGGTVDGTEYLRFNGYGHQISGLAVNGTADNQGLFAKIQPAGGEYHLQNLLLAVPSVANSAKYTGALAGWVNGAAGPVKISGVGVIDGSINGSNDFTGGLVGLNENNSTIQSCYASGSVNGTNCTGGLVGFNETNSTIQNCHASASVTGTGDYTGGLVAYNADHSTIQNCYASGSVDGYRNNGGLSGLNYTSSTIQNCYASGDVSGTGIRTGGLVGLNWDSATIQNCYASGSVNGTNCTGGLVGYNIIGSNINNCAALGSVVTGTAGTCNRVCVDSSASHSNNYAWEGMTINGSTVPAGSLSDSVNGADVSLDDALTSAAANGFYTSPTIPGPGLGWDAVTVWNIQDGSYPALQNMP